MKSKEEIIFNVIQRHSETEAYKNNYQYESVEEVKRVMNEDPDMKLFLEMMEEYANQDKWISVEERLPEPFNYSLVSLNGVVFKGRRYSNGWTCFFADGEKNVIDNDVRLITHWQPLPVPPKK